VTHFFDLNEFFLRPSGHPLGCAVLWTTCSALRAIAAPETRTHDQRIHPEGLTFDDVLLLPGKSAVLPPTPTRALLHAQAGPEHPLASAAMDTVTESRLAIAIARQGGIGIVHKNMPIDRQGEEVDRGERSESGMIVDPVTISRTSHFGRPLRS